MNNTTGERFLSVFHRYSVSDSHPTPGNKQILALRIILDILLHSLVSKLKKNHISGFRREKKFSHKGRFHICKYLFINNNKQALGLSIHLFIYLLVA